ncbi:hypothetical protein [Geobacter sulfurreducens]|uniref:hypothetical protein n=1 Tax=Geobacter sulfurreducens TaxID=35554 RepID=UPI002D1FB7E9|nr:hypothetical protein [Geobacter sulfurreducens]
MSLGYMRLQSAFAEYYKTCKPGSELDELKKALFRLGQPVDYLFDKYKGRGAKKGVDRELARPRGGKVFHKVKAISLEDFAKDPE